MVKTRFDDAEHWVVACGEVLDIEDISTTHLINIFNMLHRRPDRTMVMLITDVETGDYNDHVWTPTQKDEDAIAESIRNITSMTAEELVSYAMLSPLGKAIKTALTDRGVNVDNMLDVAAGLSNGSK